jgi:hypothetical protein
MCLLTCENHVLFVVKSKKITRQDKKIAICERSSSETMYDSSLLLCVITYNSILPFIDMES